MQERNHALGGQVNYILLQDLPTFGVPRSLWQLYLDQFKISYPDPVSVNWFWLVSSNFKMKLGMEIREIFY